MKIQLAELLIGAFAAAFIILWAVVGSAAVWLFGRWCAQMLGWA